MGEPKKIYVSKARGKWRVRTGVWDDAEKKTRFRTCGSFDSEHEARDFAETLVDELRRMRSPDRVTLRHVALSVLKDRPAYAWSLFRTHLENDAICDMEPAEIKKADVLAYLGRLRKKNATRATMVHENGSIKKAEVVVQKKKISGGTVMNAYNLFRAILRQAYTDDLCPVNVTNGLKLPKVKTTTKHGIALSPEQIDRFLAAVPLPERHMFAFMIFTGLRVGEAISLHRRDIHLDGRSPHIWVRHGGPPKRNGHGELVWPPTKGGEPRRVPLIPAAVEAYRAWEEDAPFHLDRDGIKNELGLAFPRPRGGIRSALHLLPHEQWAEVKAKAGLPSTMRVHDMRHTCATSLLHGWWGRKWPIKDVQAFLGHASSKTTEYYLHGDEEAMSEAAAETVTAPVGAGQKNANRTRSTDGLTAQSGGKDCHTLATVKSEEEGNILKSLSAPGKSRTSGQRFRKTSQEKAKSTTSEAVTSPSLPPDCHARKALLSTARALLLACESSHRGIVGHLVEALATAAMSVGDTRAEGQAIRDALGRKEDLRARTLAVALAARVSVTFEDCDEPTGATG